MSFVTTQPGLLTEAAGNLTGIGSAMDAENSAAAATTTGVVLLTSAGSYVATEAANAVAAT